MTPIKGFSKLSKEAKIEWLLNAYFEGNDKVLEQLKSYWHADGKVQKLHDEFIENTITNFLLPIGVAPNFNINGKLYCIPMAIEESSVVAAAAKSASFWLERGGFKSEVIDTEKIGHVHFNWSGSNKTVNLCIFIWEFAFPYVTHMFPLMYQIVSPRIQLLAQTASCTIFPFCFGR